MNNHPSSHFSQLIKGLNYSTNEQSSLKILGIIHKSHPRHLTNKNTNNLTIINPVKNTNKYREM